MYDVKQFKLNNGEEIVCEVVEWCESPFKEIVVRNVMKIASTRVGEEFYYVFRPWLQYQESEENLIVINSDHVVATAHPSYLLITQWAKAVSEMHGAAVDREYDYKKDYQQKLQKLVNDITNAATTSVMNDSDSPSNVIKFPETLH